MQCRIVFTWPDRQVSQNSGKKKKPTIKSVLELQVNWKFHPSSHAACSAWHAKLKTSRSLYVYRFSVFLLSRCIFVFVTTLVFLSFKIFFSFLEKDRKSIKNDKILHNVEKGRLTPLVSGKNQKLVFFRWQTTTYSNTKRRNVPLMYTEYRERGHMQIQMLTKHMAILRYISHSTRDWAALLGLSSQHFFTCGYPPWNKQQPTTG